MIYNLQRGVQYVLVFIMVCLGLFIGALQPAQAQTIPVTELKGYAWSENIGWISLNCLTGGAAGGNICGSRNYKVIMNANRTISGYAWSENIGWVKFGGLSLFPTGGGTTAVNAQVTGTYPNLAFVGWARACAGTLGGNCASMANNPDAGAWDGWISLGGTNYNVGANMTTNMNANSYAWGSTVIGWLDMFTRVTFDALTATISGTSCTIPAGASTCNGTVTWTISSSASSPNVRNNTRGVSVSTAYSGTNQSVVLAAGSNVLQAREGSIVLRSVTLSGNCEAGTSINGGGVCGAPPPTLSIRTNVPIVRQGGSASIIWTVSPDPLVDGNCTVSGPGMTSQNNITSSGNTNATNIQNNGIYTISCTGTYGTVEAKTNIEVIPSAQEV